MRYLLLSLILFIIVAIPVAQGQDVVYLIRHAEQELYLEDPPLTYAGHQRAKAWATIFRDADIKVIYTTKKVRTKQTGEAIAQELNVPLEAISRRDVDGLVNRVRKEHAEDAVLVISHTRTVPKLVEAFGYSTNGTIERDDYDNLFVIVPEGESEATVLRLRY
jgi:broad specificity phosphatase PhoE